MDERIDELQDQIFVNPKESQLADLFELKRELVTGFFGQNLGWLVNREGSLTAFLVFGIGTKVLAVIALFVMFRRRGWMGKKRRPAAPVPSMAPNGPGACPPDVPPPGRAGGRAPG